MADDVIKTITIKGKVEGVDQATAALKKLADAQGNVAVVSDTSTKSALSSEQAYARQTLRVDESARMQAKVASETKVADAALRQGLITQDEHAKRIGVINQKYGEATPLSRAFGESLKGVQYQMVALADGAGPVGVFLSSFGPWGLAAGIGLGLVKDGLEKVITMSEQLATKALQIREFANSTALTTAQVQALTEAAARHGVATDAAVGAIQKFTISWEQMRKGSGTMLDEINKIDAGLARQMKQAGDAAAAWDLFSEAVARADGSQRNLLLRAAGGRGGVQNLTGIASDTAGAGGVNNLAAEMAAAGGVLQKQFIDKLAVARGEIDATGERIHTKIASVFAGAVLENQKHAREEVEKLVDILTNFSPSAAWTSFMAWAQGSTLLGNGAGSPTRLTVNAIGSGGVYGSPSADQSLRNAPARTGPQARTSEDILAQSKNEIAILGAAATQTEIYKNKQLELAEAAKKADVSQGFVNRALRDLKITQDQANESAKQSLGVSSQSEIVRAHLIALGEQERKGLQLTTDQRNQAIVIIEKESRAQAEANQVRASSLPGLKQMELDAGRLDKQLDITATATLNNLSSALVAIGTHTATAGEAFKTFGLQVAASLQQMIVQLLIIKPLAAGLGGGLSGFFGGGGGATDVNNGYVPFVNGGGIVPTGHDGAMIGSWGTGSKYVHPAHFDGAPRLHGGGDIDWAAGERPFIGLTGERVLNRQESANYGKGGGSASITIVNNNDFRGADPGSEARMKAYVDQSSKQTVAAAVTAVARTRSNNPSYLKST